ncbi:MAG: dehydrogenase [Zetaproteobacteria bacterium]|nr:MAG: dehydrogenase [Zetaproteobacteria bacterium]
MLKAAVIGLGVGEQHARYYDAHDGCTLHSLCDLNIDKARDVAGGYDNVTITDNWRDICADNDVDIVSLASFDHHHAVQMVAALNAGKHIFVEKPLCLSRAELKEIHGIWRNSDLHIVSNLPLRTAPLFRWLKAEIAKGALGDIYAIDGEYLYGRVEKITKGWRKDIKEYSVIEGGGIHMLDLILCLTGQYPVRVASVGNQIVTKDTDFHHDDYAASTFQFESGMIARLTSNFGCVHPHQHILKVFGTKATFILDDFGPRLQKNYDPLNFDDYQKVSDKHKENPKAEEILLAPKPKSKAELIDDLVDAIKNKDDRGLTLHEFRLINVCLTAVEALKSGQTETIGIFDE